MGHAGLNAEKGRIDGDAPLKKFLLTTSAALAPNALRVMGHIGIYDRLRTSGYNYEELAFTNGAGHVLGKFLNGSQKEYNFPALRIHRTTVRQELVREVERQGIEIYWNKKCVGVKEEHENGATVPL
jgi:2-polyprenyl-6-methoxyphenol hydroxylase-like FAD-dependent oxidoreductase